MRTALVLLTILLAVPLAAPVALASHDGVCDVDRPWCPVVNLALDAAMNVCPVARAFGHTCP